MNGFSYNYDICIDFHLLGARIPYSRCLTITEGDISESLRVFAHFVRKCFQFSHFLQESYKGYVLDDAWKFILHNYDLFLTLLIKH